MIRRICRCGRATARDIPRCSRCRTKFPRLGRPKGRTSTTYKGVPNDLPASVIELIIARAHAARRPLWKAL